MRWGFKRASPEPGARSWNEASAERAESASQPLGPASAPPAALCLGFVLEAMPSHSAAPPVPPHRVGGEARERPLKCVLLGDGAVGKTSLVVSYTTNGYPTKYVPTAFDHFSAMVQVDGKPVRLQLCDTAGQDEFDKLRHLCYPRTDALLLCFSVVSPASFQNVWEKWLPEIRRRCPQVPLLLVGTQCDLREDVKVLIELARRRERPVLEADAHALADKAGAVAYVECSALTQKNLKEVFDAAIAIGLRHAERRARRDRKVRSTADKMKTLSKSWWKKYVCVQ